MIGIIIVIAVMLYLAKEINCLTRLYDCGNENLD